MLKRRTRDEGYGALKPRRLKSYVLTSDAILRIAQDALELVRAVQGARTLAMLAASLQGAVLKVGEDGLSHDLPRRAAASGICRIAWQDMQELGRSKEVDHGHDG